MSNARWTEGAACKPEDLHLFYPKGRGGSKGDQKRFDAAKAICNGCPIREVCLTKAIEEEDGWGIRGGLTPDERDALMQDGAA